MLWPATEKLSNDGLCWSIGADEALRSGFGLKPATNALLGLSLDGGDLSGLLYTLLLSPSRAGLLLVASSKTHDAPL